MTTPYLRAARRQRTLILAVLALFGWMAAPAWAQQNVILNPATVQGTVTLNGQTFSSLYVSASWTDNSANPPTYYSASTNANASTGAYTLIVNVPQGTTPTYTVYASGYLSSGQSFSFPSQNVNPDPNSPQNLDFFLDPGIIQGTVTATGGTLNAFYIYSSSTYGYFYNTTTYSLVVVPGTSIYTYGYGYGQYGGNPLSPQYQYVDVNAGQTVTGIDWSVTLPPQPSTGEINGTISLSGNVTPSSINLTASGPSYQSVYSTGSYSMTGLNVGSYYMYGSASFGSSGQSYLGFPDSMFSPQRYTTVTSGSPSTVNISGMEAFINGTVTIGGTTTLADTYYATMNVYGGFNSNSTGGYGGATLPANGAYSLVLTDGKWAPSSLNLYYNRTSDPANYLSEQLYFYDYREASNPIELAAGQTETKNLTYPTGTVTINFKALGNATFSNPQLSASCSYNDPVTNQPQWGYSAYAYNGSLQNVTEGGVSFAGMAGTCQVQATAYVNGTNYVTFGNLTVTVVPGAIQVIDIGGPTLTVTSPIANSLSPSASVVVSGSADDDVIDIGSIAVNGAPATFSSANDSAHPHKVNFSATVALNIGANPITTVVTAQDPDTSDSKPGKSASDSRTVYYDPGPLTLNWTPADGSTVGTPAITVNGTASDPGGIESILVNGQMVTFTPTGNPNEVSFSAPVTVVLGDNAITVTANAIGAGQGIASQSVTQTHHVTYAVKVAAIVNATGGSFTYTGTPHAGSGSASGDHGQALAVTLTYSGTGATSYGPTAAAPTNAGTYQVVAHTDGDAGTFAGDSAPAALVIDKAAASVSVVGYSVPFDGAAHTATGSATGLLGEPLAGLDLSGTTHAATGTYTDGWTFTDVTGNYNNTSGSVSDTISAPAYTVCGIDGPNGPKNSGSTIPIKVQICSGGVPVSSAVVHATGIELVSGTQNGSLQDSGNANPGNNFRVVGPPTSYMFNLQTKGFKSGSYNLLFTVGADPTVHAVPFSIK